MEESLIGYRVDQQTRDENQIVPVGRDPGYLNNHNSKRDEADGRSGEAYPPTAASLFGESCVRDVHHKEHKYEPGTRSR